MDRKAAFSMPCTDGSADARSATETRASQYLTSV
jgi:hypothetical protein